MIDKQNIQNLVEEMCGKIISTHEPIIEEFKERIEKLNSNLGINKFFLGVFLELYDYYLHSCFSQLHNSNFLQEDEKQTLKLELNKRVADKLNQLTNRYIK